MNRKIAISDHAPKRDWNHSTAFDAGDFWTVVMIIVAVAGVYITLAAVRGKLDQFGEWLFETLGV